MVPGALILVLVLLAASSPGSDGLRRTVPRIRQLPAALRKQQQLQQQQRQPELTTTAPPLEPGQTLTAAQLDELGVLPTVDIGSGSSSSSSAASSGFDLRHMRPAVFNVLDRKSGFGDCLWRSNESLATLLNVAGQRTSTAHFVFLADDVADVEALAAQVMSQPAGIPKALASRLHFVKRGLADMPAWVHGVLGSLPTTRDAATVVVTSSAASPASVTKAATTTTTTTVPRLDARYDWLGWSFDPTAAFHNKTVDVAYIGSGCPSSSSSSSSSSSMNLTGSIALISEANPKDAAGTPCDDYDKVRTAASANASGVVVFARDGEPVHDMNCETPAECADTNVALPATMVSFEVGQAIVASLKKGATVSMGFSTLQVRGTDFGVDSHGRLQQTWGGSGLGANATDGNPGDPSCKLYPRLAFVAYAAQWLEYQQEEEAKEYRHHHHQQQQQQELRQQRSSSSSSSPSLSSAGGPALATKRVFDAESIRPADGNCYGTAPIKCGPSKVVDLPRRPPSTVSLKLALSCNGTRDVDCPQWDHVVQLRACCSSGDSSSPRDDHQHRQPSSLVCDAQNDGYEVGRWITSFGRRVGRWTHDISPLAPLLRGRCNFTMYSAPWAGNQGATPWVATLDISYGGGGAGSWSGEDQKKVEENDEVVEEEGREEAMRADCGAACGKQVQVVAPWAKVTTEASGGGIGAVFRWVAFNQTYAERFAPFRLAVPEWARRVELVATITGHGNDNHGCGEFCATEHRFTVAGRRGTAVFANELFLAMSNQELGCADLVGTGVTPNEYGTWLYGRDGWCNGRPVPLWRADLTAAVVPGEEAVLSYAALWCSSTGHPGGAYTCGLPDPGPPKTWSQSPPVMMPAVYVAFYG